MVSIIIQNINFCFVRGIIPTILLALSLSVLGQNENKNWYFGMGTDGIVFDSNKNPQKVNDKVTGIGFEGMIVVSDPLTGFMKFYSDGKQVINSSQSVMTNGTGLSGHESGAQCVQSCPVPGSCPRKYYLFTNSAYDLQPGTISYSIIDFSIDLNGKVTNKNTAMWSGPSDQGMCMVAKPNSDEYWLIANSFKTATYYVFQITASGISTPSSYTFDNKGSSYQMNYDSVAKKIVVTGWEDKHITLIDFNAKTGALSNETSLIPPFSSGPCASARFSPDGTKLYASVDPPNVNLVQYDFTTQVWTNMNTCCFAHDLKVGPDGRMYHIHTYNDAQPMAVIESPNASAVNNACNYHKITFSPAFNGEVRRFPEFLTAPPPPIASPDTLTIDTSSAFIIDVLANDTAPLNDTLKIEAIISGPTYGIASVSGGKITYYPIGCHRSDSFIYQVTTAYCGKDTAIVFIKSNVTNGVVNASVNSPVCSGSPLNFTATDIPGASYSWRGSNGFTSAIKDPIISSSEIADNGMYTVTATVNGCQMNPASIYVVVYDLPVVNLGNDTAFCERDSIILDAQNNGSTFLWDDLSTSQQRKVKIPGEYSVKVTDSHQCISTDTIKLDTFPLPHLSLGEDIIVPCNENSIGLTAGMAYAYYLWQNTFTGTEYTINQPGTYWLQVKDNNGCSAFDTINVFFAQGTKIQIQQGIIYVCEEDTLIGPQNQFTSYLWQDGSTSQKFLAQADGIYTVVVTDSNSCIDSASIEVKNNCPGAIYIPNVFSPNGDGVNEVFCPVMMNMKTMQMEIYDRWGQRVFETNQLNGSWDGKTKGVPLPPDVYTYRISCTDVNNILKGFRGTVTLLR